MLKSKGRKVFLVFLLFFLPFAFGAGNENFLESQLLKGGKSFERLQIPQNRTIAPAKLTQVTSSHRDLNRGGEVPICTSHTALNPAIYGDKIVWADYRNDYYDDIFMYDLSTGQERVICTAPGNQTDPAIYGDKIVWEDGRNGNADIYMYDLSTGQEKAICTAPGNQIEPAIYGNKIVWADERNGNWDIYMYDLSLNKEIPICTAPGSQLEPAIYEDKIVWQDDRNGDYDIYLFDLSTMQEVPICREVYDQKHPFIWGSTVVWLVDKGPFIYDFEGFNINTKEPFTIYTIPSLNAPLKFMETK